MNKVNRSELYYVDLSPVVGSKQGGIRPVPILQNDKTNQNSITTIVAVMTSQIKKNLQTHVKVSGHGLKKESLVLLEQLKAIDKLRLLQYIGRLGDKDTKKIGCALTENLSIKIRRCFQVDNMNCAFYYEVNVCRYCCGVDTSVKRTITLRILLLYSEYSAARRISLYLSDSAAFLLNRSSL